MQAINKIRIKSETYEPLKSSKFDYVIYKKGVYEEFGDEQIICNFTLECYKKKGNEGFVYKVSIEDKQLTEAAEDFISQNILNQADDI